MIAPGTSLGRYQIRTRLGAGGMGAVYLAFDPELERSVAVKVLPEDLAADAARLARFVREAKAASALNHPNILTVHDFGTHEATRFLVTEYVDGRTLRQWLAENRPALADVLDVMAQAATALDAAHTAAIVHRDIKPENLMLRRDGLVKVLDFGIAKLTAAIPTEHDTGASPTAQAQTLPGAILGTVRYMSPEQATGTQVDARSDVWSLGVVLYELVAGRAPFLAETRMGTLAAILEREPEPLERAAPGAPAPLCRLVGRTLRKPKEERLGSAGELAAELRRLKDAIEQYSLTIADPLDPPATAETRRVEVPGRAVTRPPPRRRAARRSLNSLAVLPFLNASGDQEIEYLGEGITEAVINNLSRLSKLRVMARSTVFRFKGRPVDPRAIGDELGVRAVVTGRVLRVGERVVVNAELVDTSDGAQLWGERYNRAFADVLEVQDAITTEISERLRMRLSGAERQRLAKRPSASPRAYHLYLKGRYAFARRTEEGLRTSIDYFDAAIEEDPVCAAAYGGLSDSYAMLALRGLAPAGSAFVKAKAAARKALEIDPAYAEASASLAHIRLHDWDWSGLDDEFRHALELNPGHANAYYWYSEYLSATGRAREALAMAERARQTDPLSPMSDAMIGSMLYMARETDRAIAYLRTALEVNPDHFLLHFNLGEAYTAAGQHEAAVAAMREAVALSERSTETLAGLGQACAASGRREEARALLGELAGRSAEHYVSPYSVAKIHVALGDTDCALEWLEQAYAERNPHLIDIGVEPVLDGVRSSPRFAALLRGVGLALKPADPPKET
jgi:serine/threonine protein kinase/Tfp pilus assembly protein PilF